MHYRIFVRSVLKGSEKMKPLVIAILEAAARQEATLYELEKACELAATIVREEMSQSNVCVDGAAQRGIAELKAL